MNRKFNFSINNGSYGHEVIITCLTQIGVKKCPDSGAGVHNWVYYGASSCKRAGLPAQRAVDLIKQEMSRDPKPYNEVEQAVNAAYSLKSEDSDSNGFPDCDMDSVRALVKNGLSLDDLKRLSPVSSPKQQDVLASLFKTKELLCVGRTLFNPEIVELPEAVDKWRFPGAQFIVPSPMLAAEGLTKDGKKSARCLSNTGPRRWLVIECDFEITDVESLGVRSTFDLCASVLWKLSEYRPLVLVVSSGSRSLHGWFPVQANEPETLETSKLWKFMARACMFGADSKTWTKCQWLRMPGGIRRGKNGQISNGPDGCPIVQEIVYFNPDAARRYLP
jgi:hypothetical protein